MTRRMTMDLISRLTATTSVNLSFLKMSFELFCCDFPAMAMTLQKIIPVVNIKWKITEVSRPKGGEKNQKLT